MGGYNVGVLNMQTDAAVDRAHGRDDRAGQQLHRAAAAARSRAVELRRDVRRPAGRLATGAGDDDYNRAYGVDLGVAGDDQRTLFAFLARTDSPEARAAPTTRAALFTPTPTDRGAASTRLLAGRRRFNPEVGFLRRRAYRQVEGRYNLSYQPKRWPWIRRIQPHANYHRLY